MIRNKLLLTVSISAMMSFSQMAVAEEAKAKAEGVKTGAIKTETAIKKFDTKLLNQVHASIDTKSKEEKDKPFWSDDQKQQAELEKRYKQDIADDPDNKKNYAYLAGLYLTNNKTGKAIDAYQDAIMHDPVNPKLFAAISIAYLHHSKFAMAKTMADEALRLDPSMKQVEKINEYIVAKQKAIEAASKIPAGGEKSGSMGSGKAPHGSVMPAALGTKPSDAVHGPKSHSPHSSTK